MPALIAINSKVALDPNFVPILPGTTDSANITWHEYLNYGTWELNIIDVYDVSSAEECRRLCTQDPQVGRCRVATFKNATGECWLKACTTDALVMDENDGPVYTSLMVSPYDAKECSE